MLILIWVGLKPAAGDQDFKKKFVFEVSISNRLFFCANQGSGNENPTNAYFGHQRAAKLNQRELKTFKWPFLGHFWLKWAQIFCGAFGVQTYASSKKKRLRSVKLCFLDLNLSCFQSWGPSWKIFKEKNLSSENIKCLNMMPKHFLFPWPKSKMFWWISIKKNAKKRRKNAFFSYLRK